MCAFQVEDARQSDSVRAHACLFYGLVISFGCGKICRVWNRVPAKNPLMETEQIFADRTQMAPCRNEEEKMKWTKRKSDGGGPDGQPTITERYPRYGQLHSTGCSVYVADTLSFT